MLHYLLVVKVPRRHARCLFHFVLICFVSILLITLSFSIQNHKDTSRNLFFFSPSQLFTHIILIHLFLFSTVLRISILNLFLPYSRTWLYEPASATAQQPHFKHTNSRQSRFKWTLLHYFWFFVFRIFLVISSKRIIASQWPAV